MKSINLKSKLIKANTQPGSVVYTGTKKSERSRIELITYDEHHFTRSDIAVEDIHNIEAHKVNWINIVGVNDTETIEKIGQILDLDFLILEDIVTIGSRPKFDNYNDYLFVLLNTILIGSTDRLFRIEQISILLKGNMIITFQEIEGDMFGFVRNRIEDSKGRIRKSSASYLLYCLIDAIVDQYFFTIDEIDKNIEVLEDDIINDTMQEQSKRIYSLRRNLMELKNTIWPIRDIIEGLIIEEAIFSKEEKNYLNDVKDNIKQIMDSISTYRDLTMALYEIFLSNISNKMNKIMTTLTIISVIFIPLTFLSSVYGMNFRYMPELNIRWGYLAFWVVSVVIFVTLFVFFKRKNWFV
ncbi:MAG: magnesium/cobalt transporter CorA [Eubacteriales bacterium]